MQIPKSEEVRQKIQSNLEAVIEHLLKMCVEEIATMTADKTTVSVCVVTDDIPDLAILEVVDRLRTEWIVDSKVDDAGLTVIRISLPAKHEIEFKGKALRELLLACDDWAPRAWSGDFNRSQRNRSQHWRSRHAKEQVAKLALGAANTYTRRTQRAAGDPIRHRANHCRWHVLAYD